LIGMSAFSGDLRFLGRSKCGRWASAQHFNFSQTDKLKEVRMVRFDSQPIRWAAILGCSLVLAALGLSVSARGQNSDVTPKATFAPEHSVGTGDIVYRSATMLVRTHHYVFATIRTSGLQPGNVYTAWFAIFNNPRYCATDPCSAADLSNPDVEGSLVNFGGQLVGPDGTAEYAEVRAVGDATNAQLGPGLLNSRGAQIHLTVRNHGPALADPTAFAQQLTMFNGGCPPNACVTIQAAVHEP